MKLGTKSYYTHKLDDLLSKKIRSIERCERCGKKDYLQCAHIISRKNRTLRWDMDNTLALCAGCHFWAHSDPLGFAEFVKTKFPIRYMRIMRLKDTTTKRTAKDLKALYEEFDQGLGEDGRL